MVINNSSANDVFKCHVKLEFPNGWHKIIGPDVIELTKNEEKLLLLNLQSSGNALVGNYNVKIRLFNDSGEELASENIECSIKKRISFGVKSWDIEKYYHSGDTIWTQFQIENTGNCAIIANIETVNCSYLGKSNIDFELDSIRKIPICIPLPSDILVPIQYSFSIILQYKDGCRYISKTIKVLPLNKVKLFDTKSFPISFGLNAINERNASVWRYGSQFELFSVRPIEIFENHFLDFSSRGPNRFRKSVLGQMDEHFVNYKNKFAEVKIGDQIFSSSRLTEFVRSGRGVNTRFDFKKFEFGGFYNTPRFFKKINEEYSFYTKYKGADTYEIETVYLSKKIDKEHNELFSAILRSTLSNNFNMESEISYGKSFSKDGIGFLYTGRYSSKKLKGNSTFIYSSQNYPGYYQNSFFCNANLSYRITKGSTIALLARRDEQNSKRDTLLGQAPLTKNVMLRYGYDSSIDSRFTFQVTLQERKDRLEEVKFDYSEKYSRLGYWKRFGQFDLEVYTRSGYYKNNLTGLNGYMFSFESELGFKNKYGSLRGGISYENSRKYSEIHSQDLIYDLTLNMNLGKKANCRFNYRNAFSPEEYYRNRSFLDFNLNVQFGKGTSLELFGNHSIVSKSFNDRNIAFGVKLRKTFNIHINKKNDFGFVIGCIDNYGAESVEGIVLYMNGHVAITDKEGFFKFVNLSPGTYDLLIDKTSIAIQDIPISKMPIKVVVHKGGNRVQFGITKSAKLSCNFYLNGEKGILSGILAEIYEGVMVELSNGTDKIQKFAKGRDELVFNKITPGVWKVKASYVGDRFNVRFLTDEKFLTIEPGGNHEFAIKLFYEDNKVKFMQNKINIE
ncbi:hypothetical protein QUH73_18630 [Labilibaculum sp. K2S]|uniref:COG1470 family protein n=1 Tax=Labilibaculum sp. K2S TaxID=3056386 RepID=UPI0025A43657|nr:hypothetical protein [Labilibaculum sp. K2S]MDM8161839.1 hypothetical protein [Labilibaculum sp. K2S]